MPLNGPFAVNVSVVHVVLMDRDRRSGRRCGSAFRAKLNSCQIKEKKKKAKN